MHAELDRLDLAALAERLEDLEDRRTPVGWSTEDAVLRSAVERRILEVVQGHRRTAEGSSEAPSLGHGLSCELAIGLHSKKRTMRATLRHLGEGGAVLDAEGDAQDFPPGTPVNLSVRDGGAEDRGLRARGTITGPVAWPSQGLGVSFAEQPSAAHERRLRRFVLALLRHRVG